MQIDPLNPDVVYIGGMRPAPRPGGGLIRVDTTGVMDAQAIVAYDNGAVDATNPIQFSQSTGNVTTRPPPPRGPAARAWPTASSA